MSTSIVDLDLDDGRSCALAFDVGNSPFKSAPPPSCFKAKTPPNSVSQPARAEQCGQASPDHTGKGGGGGGGGRRRVHCRADGGGQELDREESPGVKTKSSHAANDMAYYIREGRWEGRACGNWVEVMAVGGGRRRRRSNSRCSVAATDTGSPVYDRRSAGAETTLRAHRVVRRHYDVDFLRYYALTVECDKIQPFPTSCFRHYLKRNLASS
ncbi:hypothetical protein OUZ56_023268 [Daphnia magna]|uniref:Uncharacterized protein n=1 Tax=Daphnia magna TaxID=35525 RepID=A0ABR0AYR9_9CRUS|nr:hypothetical protein OUZ56_023268 [Daphnia magna]